MLEEELRQLRLEYDDLRRGRSEADSRQERHHRGAPEPAADQQQPHASELQGLINDLQRERENLRQEIERFQKQALEVFTNI